MGEVKVPVNAYWGAQTQRSRENFKIGPDATMPLEVIYGFAYLKKAAAHANYDLKVLSEEKKNLISQACDEILEGQHDDQFPLVIWQTGSGTQSNMNANEVIANRGHVLNGGKLMDFEKALHPNDDVNKSQTPNATDAKRIDSFFFNPPLPTSSSPPSSCRGAPWTSCAGRARGCTSSGAGPGGPGSS